MSQPITVVCGATATGKSSYVFKLAKQFKAVTIISVDSRQLYKYIPVVSGQDSLADLPNNVELFGQGILEPNQASNIGDFKKYVDAILVASQKRNRKIILVGGSGLYLKAITENLNKIFVAPDPKFRAKAETMTVQELQIHLKKINPNLFNSLNNSDANNPRRLIRHIEISRHCESRNRAEATPAIEGITQGYSWIGLKKSPENLLKSINQRVISRIENGAIEEVNSLLKNYPDISLPIYSTLGVKQILKYIKKEITKDELINIWTIADNNYAKRQLVWFKKQKTIVWYDNNI